MFVASGDLSHKLKDDGPYGYAPEGPVFDERVAAAMASGDFLQFLTMDSRLCDRAAECGLCSFQIMAGSGAVSGLPGPRPRMWPGRSCRTPFPPAAGTPVFRL